MSLLEYWTDFFPSWGSFTKRAKAFIGLPTYQYRPLKRDIPSIRLLTISPGRLNDPLEGYLSVVSLQVLERDDKSIPPWEALSYCWRSSTTLKLLLISSKVLKITGSLYVALQHLRRSDGERTIWIDQGCLYFDRS
jgi:hypothetical protein